MTDRFVTVPDSLELPAAVKVPSARLSDSTAAGRALLASADAAAQRSALGLDTAATTPAADYATAAQGAKADAAATALAGRLSEAALSSTFGARQWDMVSINPAGLTLYGTMLSKSSSAGFDYGYVESPMVFYDHENDRLGMLYTGYSLATTDPATVSSIGIAHSTNGGFTWAKDGQFFTASGEPGTPDEHGVTGPVIIWDDGWHLFYIGLNAAGYEGGVPTICHASAPTLSGPWDRDGTMIGPGAPGTWRGAKVWHPNIVRRGDLWYLFFNASDGSVERCGYATATSLAGPWSVHDDASPILPDTDHTTDKIWGGDPCVWWTGSVWRMDFACANSAWVPQGDYFATCAAEDFPLGWEVQGQVTSYAAGQGFKPWVSRIGGRILHYGSGGSVAGIVMSATRDLESAPQKIKSLWTFDATRATSGDSSMVVGTDLGSGTAFGGPKVTIGSIGADSEVVIGQGPSNNAILAWKRNATAAMAWCTLETYAGTNGLRIQNNGGAVCLGGSSGKVGFFGTTAGAVKPTVTGSRTDGTALASLLTALAGLGLLTNSSTA